LLVFEKREKDKKGMLGTQCGASLVLEKGKGRDSDRHLERATCRRLNETKL